MNSQPPRWEDNLHSTNPVPQLGWTGGRWLLQGPPGRRDAGTGPPLPVPPATPPNPWPIHLQWGFPGWPHDTLHDITCLLIIALQSATRQQRRMGLVTDALTEWLCPAVPCCAPPANPLPKSRVSAAKETQATHSWRLLAPSFQHKHMIFPGLL